MARNIVNHAKVALAAVAVVSLMTASARHWGDGYLYSIIRYGRAGMPHEEAVRGRS